MVRDLPGTNVSLGPRALAATRWGLVGGVLLSLFVSLGPDDQAPALSGFPPSGGTASRLLLFEPSTAGDLVRVLERAWGAGPDGAVPNVAPSRFPADMGLLGAEERKTVFVRSVLPHILQANQRIARERAALLGALGRLEEGRSFTSAEKAWLAGLVRRYRLDEEAVQRVRADPGKLLADLLRRVDEVPPSLALAQAAVESGWGSSRFALQGNALFGQWVFSVSAGMAPGARPDGASYGVARFENVAESVDAYLQNLNTLWAYEPFRELRARLRKTREALDPYKLAQGLTLYSAAREEYVDKLCRVIRANRLVRFDPSRTRAVGPGELPGVLSVSDAVPASSPAGRFPLPDA